MTETTARLSELPPAPDYLQNDEARAAYTQAGQWLLDQGELDELRLGLLECYAAFVGLVEKERRAGIQHSQAMIDQLNMMRASYGLPPVGATVQ